MEGAHLFNLHHHHYDRMPQVLFEIDAEGNPLRPPEQPLFPENDGNGLRLRVQRLQIVDSPEEQSLDPRKYFAQVKKQFMWDHRTYYGMFAPILVFGLGLPLS